MFELFGEFNSADELNLAAAGQLEQGEIESLKKLAEENGIDPDMTDMYIQGIMPYLCDDMTAAIGKIEIEKKHYKNQFFEHMLDDLTGYITSRCTEQEFAKAVRAKGKKLNDCLDNLQNEVKKILGGKNGGVANHTVFKIISNYYLE